MEALSIRLRTLCGSKATETQSEKYLQNDHEQKCPTKAKEMESVEVIGNSKQLFRHIKESGIKTSKDNEIIVEKMKR